MTAKEVFDLLIEDGIIDSKGAIEFTLNHVTAKVCGLDAMGHLIQEWFYNWALSKNVSITPNPHSQEFPDYYLNKDDLTKDLLEIKSFNYNASPAFDVADFFEYIDYLPTKPYKLEADYLIFGYEMSKSGDVTIKKIWLKKIWEIVGKSKTNFITCQIRNGKNGRRPYKIRPCNFPSSGSGFNSASEFLEQLQKLLIRNTETVGSYDDWYTEVKEGYEVFYNKKIK